jgi:hypothetical protein
VVASEGGETKIIANSGFKHVAEVSADGKLLGRHECKIPDTDVIGYLRTAVGKDGSRYYVGLASASTQKQVHLFDESWQLVRSIPEVRDHAGIADLQLADLDGDGQFELNVAYWGVVGVHGVSLDGRRLWANRSMEHAFRLAVAGPDADGRRMLLCAHSQGTLIPIDWQGNAGKPIAVGDKFIRSILSADLNGDGQPELLGLSPISATDEVAVGISPAGGELWSYPLPRGVHENPIEMVTSGKLVGGRGQWILAGADGSVHILEADGRPLDRFHYGTALTGIAVAEIAGKPVLLIATKQGIDAWRVE